MCRRFRAQFDPVTEDMTVGIALNVRGTTEHINGLRHRPEGHTAGWYIWAGQEFSEAGDFFKPLHVTHLKNWCPQVLKYLALPPGWRFLVARTTRMCGSTPHYWPSSQLHLLHWSVVAALEPAGNVRRLCTAIDRIRPSAVIFVVRPLATLRWLAVLCRGMRIDKL